MHRVPVRDIMSKEPVTIERNLPVDVALETMMSNDVRRLPVVSPTGAVAGIITRYDAMLALKKDSDWFGQTEEVPSVNDTMTANVITLGPDDTVGRAARLMLNHKIGGLPVVEAAKLVGIVTESDLFRYIAEQFDDED